MSGKKNLLVQFERGKKKEMSSFLLTYVFSKEEAILEMDKPILYLPRK